MSTTHATGDNERRPHPAAKFHEERKAHADGQIMAAVIEVLAKRGLPRFTVEEVARESGVAKTTIYRRHADARALAGAAQLAPGADVDLDAILREIKEAVDAAVTPVVARMTKAGQLRESASATILTALAVA